MLIGHFLLLLVRGMLLPCSSLQPTQPLTLLILILQALPVKRGLALPDPAAHCLWRPIKVDILDSPQAATFLFPFCRDLPLSSVFTCT